MACPFPPEELSAYADGELGEGQRDRLRQHLQHCARCAQTVASFHTITHHLRNQPEVVLRESLAQRVAARLLDGRAPAPMSCAAAQEAASAYMDAELERGAAARLEAHLFECDACMMTLGLMQACAAAQQTEAAAPPPRLRRRILAVAEECSRKWLAGRLWLRRTMSVLRVLAPAMAVAVLALVGLRWMNRPAERSAQRPPVAAMRPVPSAEREVAGHASAEGFVGAGPRSDESEKPPKRPSGTRSAPTHVTSSAPVAPATKATSDELDEFWGERTPSAPTPRRAPAPEVDNVNPTAMAMLPPALVRAQSHIAPVEGDSNL